MLFNIIAIICSCIAVLGGFTGILGLMLFFAFELGVAQKINKRLKALFFILFIQVSAFNWGWVFAGGYQSIKKL